MLRQRGSGFSNRYAVARIASSEDLGCRGSDAAAPSEAHRQGQAVPARERSEAKSRPQEFTGHRSSWVGKSYKVVHVKCDLGESFSRRISSELVFTWDEVISSVWAPVDKSLPILLRLLRQITFWSRHSGEVIASGSALSASAASCGAGRTNGALSGRC
jgi:hypothetical protein